jgi:hypothetical protein
MDRLSRLRVESMRNMLAIIRAGRPLRPVIFDWTYADPDVALW